MQPGKLHTRSALALLYLSLLMLAMGRSPAAQADVGETLIDKYQCRHCHIISGSGSLLAPPLDGIGKHRSDSYIQGRLKGDKTGPLNNYPVPAEIMGHVVIPSKDAKLIAQFLSKLPEREFPPTGHGVAGSVVPSGAPAGSRFVPEIASDSSKRGALLYRDKGCMACHTVGGAGGTIGPALDGVGARRSRNFIKARITAGAIFLPKPGEPSRGYSMPAMKLNSAEIDDLTNWVLTLPQKSQR